MSEGGKRNENSPEDASLFNERKGKTFEFASPLRWAVNASTSFTPCDTTDSITVQRNKKNLTRNEIHIRSKFILVRLQAKVTLLRREERAGWVVNVYWTRKWTRVKKSLTPGNAIAIVRYVFLRPSSYIKFRKLDPQGEELSTRRRMRNDRPHIFQHSSCNGPDLFRMRKSSSVFKIL